MGFKGLSGEKGIKGDLGPKGMSIQGIKGEKGSVGPRGPPTIIPGPTGPMGPKGNGVKGNQGSIGQKGEIGTNGVKGQEGIIGSQGEQGIQGVKGQKGEIGTSPLVKTYFTFSSYIPIKFINSINEEGILENSIVWLNNGSSIFSEFGSFTVQNNTTFLIPTLSIPFDIALITDISIIARAIVRNPADQFKSLNLKWNKNDIINVELHSYTDIKKNLGNIDNFRLVGESVSVDLHHNLDNNTNQLLVCKTLDNRLNIGCKTINEFNQISSKALSVKVSIKPDTSLGNISGLLQSSEIQLESSTDSNIDFYINVSLKACVW